MLAQILRANSIRTQGTNKKKATISKYAVRRDVNEVVHWKTIVNWRLCYSNRSVYCSGLIAGVVVLIVVLIAVVVISLIVLLRLRYTYILST